MSFFNHRVIKHVFDYDMNYEVHECYYNDGASPTSLPRSWAEGPASPIGETLDEFHRSVEDISRAIESPILLIDHREDTLYLQELPT